MQQNISSYSVLSPEVVIHDNAYIAGRSENNINASCMTISGERTEQLDIFCHVTGFTSDFLSFIDIELIRFFHGALQLRYYLYTEFTNIISKAGEFFVHLTDKLTLFTRIYPVQ